MVSEVLRFLSATGKAGVFSGLCAGLARSLNLTFTRL
jgi:phage shock protein PspC (stress-responsive transcriptional regulator)